MAGKSQVEPRSEAPDPSVRTTEQLHQTVGDAEATIDAKFDVLRVRLDGIDRATSLLHADLNRFPTDIQKEIAHLKELTDIRLEAQTEISAIREQYRIELKGDSKEALATAMTAAEKAVQAALAAAEKAREQEVARTLLANDKTEKAFAEALKQMGETFTVAIANIVGGLAEVKEEVSTSRATRLGGQANVTQIYQFVAFIAVVIGILFATGAFK